MKCVIGVNRAVSAVARDSPITDSVGPTARRVTADSSMTIEMAIFVDYEMYKRYWTDFGADAENRLQDFVSTVFNNVRLFLQLRWCPRTHRFRFRYKSYTIIQPCRTRCLSKSFVMKFSRRSL